MKKCSTQNTSQQYNKKLLFVDWDGTLSDGRFWSSLRDTASTQYEIGKKIQDYLFSSKSGGKLVKKWMKGKVTSEHINKHLSLELRVEYDFLWSVFKSDCLSMPVFQESLDAIQSLRTECIVVLITGNMDSFTRFTRPSLKLDDYFDEIVNSSDVGKLKTEYRGSEFKRIAKKYSTALKESVLIDDSKKVCEVFEKLGGTSMLVSTRQNTFAKLSELRNGHSGRLREL